VGLSKDEYDEPSVLLMGNAEGHPPDSRPLTSPATFATSWLTLRPQSSKDAPSTRATSKWRMQTLQQAVADRQKDQQETPAAMQSMCGPEERWTLSLATGTTAA
jgi:hypothetical protein